MKKLNKYYIKHKESELKKLDEKKARLSEEIGQERSKLNANRLSLEKIKSENTLIKDAYKNLKNMIVSRGIIFDIENNSYNIKEWDNLFVEKKGSKYVVAFKNGEELYNFEKDHYILLQDLFSVGYSCSLVVIRVSSKSIKIQLRFINEKSNI